MQPYDDGLIHLKKLLEFAHISLDEQKNDKMASTLNLLLQKKILKWKCFSGLLNKLSAALKLKKHQINN